MSKQLDTKRMLKEIVELCSDDFSEDVSFKLLPRSEPFTQAEAKTMAEKLGRIYSISHCITCTACQTKHN